MSYLFKVVTNEGYCLKILSELLQYNIKTSYYEIDSLGIKLKMSDNKQHMFFDINLLSENFNSFELNTDKICFGINQIYMYTMLKTIKKKDIVTLFIKSDSPTNLGIQIEPREKTKVSCSYIKIYPAHNIQLPELNNNYTYSCPITSSDYTKTCKEMSKLCKTITISSCKTGVKFYTTTSNIYSKEVIFGNYIENSNCSSQNFMSEYLANISKISGMSSIIHVHQLTDNSIMFRSNIGTLGKILIYIKSDEQINEINNDDILEI